MKVYFNYHHHFSIVFCFTATTTTTLLLFPFNSLVEDKTCAGIYGPQEKDGKRTSACKGDSGGPLVCQKGGNITWLGLQAGVWSAMGEAEFTGLFNDVTFFIERSGGFIEILYDR